MNSEVESGWRPVTSGVPQKSVLGPVLFNTINHLDKGIVPTLSKYTNDTELGRMADTPESCVPFSETCKGWRADYRGNLGYSTNILNADKCRALHLGRNNCTDHQYRLRTELLEENSSDRGLGVLTDHEPAVCP